MPSPNGLSLTPTMTLVCTTQLRCVCGANACSLVSKKYLTSGTVNASCACTNFTFAYCEAAFKHRLISVLQMTWKRDGYDLAALKAKDGDDSVKFNGGVVSGCPLLPLLPPLPLIRHLHPSLHGRRRREIHRAVTPNFATERLVS